MGVGKEFFKSRHNVRESGSLCMVNLPAIFNYTMPKLNKNKVLLKIKIEFSNSFELHFIRSVRWQLRSLVSISYFEHVITELFVQHARIRFALAQAEYLPKHNTKRPTL